MAGPFWLAGPFAAVVILVGAYSASRLAVSLRRGWATESDADALHAVMGAAMAGMLVPRLSVLPSSVWVVIFAIAAAWFGWRAVRSRGFTAAGPVRVYVDGVRVHGSPQSVGLRPHSEVVVELGGYVPPHRFYIFPEGT